MVDSFLHKRRFPQTYKQFIHKITSCLQKLCTMVDNSIKFLYINFSSLFITAIFVYISVNIHFFLRLIHRFVDKLIKSIFFVIFSIQLWKTFLKDGTLLNGLES